jgi:hypothetical protein
VRGERDAKCGVRVRIYTGGGADACAEIVFEWARVRVRVRVRQLRVGFAGAARTQQAEKVEGGKRRVALVLAVSTVGKEQAAVRTEGEAHLHVVHDGDERGHPREQ